jgi:hypothetical protein
MTMPEFTMDDADDYSAIEDGDDRLYLIGISSTMMEEWESDMDDLAYQGL